MFYGNKSPDGKKGERIRDSFPFDYFLWRGGLRVHWQSIEYGIWNMEYGVKMLFQSIADSADCIGPFQYKPRKSFPKTRRLFKPMHLYFKRHAIFLCEEDAKESEKMRILHGDQFEYS